MPTSLTDFFSAVFAFCLVEMINEDIISECSVNSFWDPKFGSMFRYINQINTPNFTYGTVELNKSNRFGDFEN